MNQAWQQRLIPRFQPTERIFPSTALTGAFHSWDGRPFSNSAAQSLTFRCRSGGVIAWMGGLASIRIHIALVLALATLISARAAPALDLDLKVKLLKESQRSIDESIATFPPVKTDCGLVQGSPLCSRSEDGTTARNLARFPIFESDCP